MIQSATSTDGNSKSRLWTWGIIAAEVLAVNFLPWTGYVFSFIRNGLEATVGSNEIALAPGWFTLTTGSALVGRQFGLTGGAVMFATAGGVLISQTRFVVIGPVEKEVVAQLQ